MPARPASRPAITPVLTVAHHVRLQKGMTLVMLADACGINPTYLSLWERGRYIATPNELDQIAAALGVPANRLTERIVVAPEAEAVTA